jgi:hypothetical protein
MYRLFFTPEWFNGFDLVFETIGLIIALMIAFYSYKIFRFSKENKFVYFSLAFVLVALGLGFKMFTSSVLYFFPLRESVAIVLKPVMGGGLTLADLFYRAAFFMQMSVMLSAWLLIFFISQKSRERLKKYHEISQIALFIYLILLISIVANFRYFIFYLTSAVILGMTVLNYYKNYLNSKRNKNSFRVMLSFLFILFSNIIFIFVSFYDKLYIVGEVIMLIGFLLLLSTYRRITKK